MSIVMNDKFLTHEEQARLGEDEGWLDFDSDEPLACPLRQSDDDQPCESCQ